MTSPITSMNGLPTTFRPSQYPTKEEHAGLDDMALANLMEEFDKDVEVCKVALFGVLFNLGKMSRHSEPL